MDHLDRFLRPIPSGAWLLVSGFLLRDEKFASHLTEQRTDARLPCPRRWDAATGWSALLSIGRESQSIAPEPWLLGEKEIPRRKPRADRVSLI